MNDKLYITDSEYISSLIANVETYVLTILVVSAAPHHSIQTPQPVHKQCRASDARIPIFIAHPCMQICYKDPGTPSVQFPFHTTHILALFMFLEAIMHTAKLPNSENKVKIKFSSF